MWNNIKNFLKKLVSSGASVTENKTEKREPKVKQLKKVNYKKKAKFRS